MNTFNQLKEIYELTNRQKPVILFIVEDYKSYIAMLKFVELEYGKCFLSNVEIGSTYFYATVESMQVLSTFKNTFWHCFIQDSLVATVQKYGYEAEIKSSMLDFVNDNSNYDLATKIYINK